MQFPESQYKLVRNSNHEFNLPYSHSATHFAQLASIQENSSAGQRQKIQSGKNLPNFAQDQHLSLENFQAFLSSHNPGGQSPISSPNNFQGHGSASHMQSLNRHKRSDEYPNAYLMQHQQVFLPQSTNIEPRMNHVGQKIANCKSGDLIKSESRQEIQQQNSLQIYSLNRHHQFGGDTSKTLGPNQINFHIQDPNRAPLKSSLTYEHGGNWMQNK